jgi:hypothetical protein
MLTKYEFRQYSKNFLLKKIGWASYKKFYETHALQALQRIEVMFSIRKTALHWF